MRTRTLLTIGLLAILAGFLSFAMLVSQLAGGAVDAALRENSTPDTAQKVTAVCIGLNIGSCRTTQESTTKPAGIPGAGLLSAAPWPAVGFATTVIVFLLVVVMFRFDLPKGWID